VLQLKTQSVKSTKKSYIRVSTRAFNRVPTIMYLSLYTKLIVHTIWILVYSKDYVYYIIYCLTYSITLSFCNMCDQMYDTVSYYIMLY